METTETQPRARLLQAYAPWLAIPIDGKETGFIAPLFKPANYRDSGKAILQAGFQLPTGKEMALYLDEVYNSSNPEIKGSPKANEVRNAMRANWLWDFKKNLYTLYGPENERGIYLARDAKAIGLSAKLDRAELEKMLDPRIEVDGVKFSSDYSLAFAPESTYLNKPFNSSNGYLIARGEGKEGAEALVRVSKNSVFRNSGTTFLRDIINKDTEQVSTLSDYDDARLNVDGYYWGDGNMCRAFGVLRDSAEGSAQKAGDK